MNVELCCGAIVALYVVVRALYDRAPLRFLLRLGLLVVAAWIAEDTVIRAYGFYAYSRKWSVFVDRVPLMVVLIWPVVIHSAHDLARHLAPRHVTSVAASIVCFDAALIEPIAVRAGLWHWTEPGLFGVPPIGILGWAVFGFFAVLTLDRKPRLLIPVAVVATHATLVLAWWTLFRWVNAPIPAAAAVVGIWLVAIPLTVAAVRRRVPLHEMLLRVPGALFFFVLLAIETGQNDGALIAYAVAFALPYLVLTWRT